MKNTTHKKGFTLIDVLLTTAIVSLLSSVILFTVSEAKTKAQDARMKTESGQVANAVELFKADNAGFTPIKVWTSEGKFKSKIMPGVLYKEGSEEYKEFMNKLVEGNYISKIPQSPDGTSYAYGESIDGTQAMFAAQLKNQSNSSTNTRTSCSVIEQKVVEPVPCKQGDIPIAIPSPTYDQCTYKAPTFTSEFLSETSGTITITEPASWDCSNISYLNDPIMNCWEIGEAGPFPDPCGIQGYTVGFSDGIYPKFNCPAPEPARAYSCIGTYYNPPPCDSVPKTPGYTCTNISAETYEICPITTEDENLCDGTSNSDYCTCI